MCGGAVEVLEALELLLLWPCSGTAVRVTPGLHKGVATTSIRLPAVAFAPFEVLTFFS